MPRYLYDIEQKSPEWYEKKLGKFSGSDFHIFLGNSDARTVSLLEKTYEHLYHDMAEGKDFSNAYMDRGNALESEARRLFSATYEQEVREVGLVEDDGEFDGWAVCSPDGLIGDNGIIEIKCLIAKNLLNNTIRKGFTISPTYETQVQFNLMVTGREYCIFIYYHPRIGLVTHRYERDEAYIEKIKEALRRSIKEIKEFEEKITGVKDA